MEAPYQAMLDGPGDIVTDVNPFGSDSHGAAIVTVTSEGMGTDRMVCVFDKDARTSELTAPF